LSKLAMNWQKSLKNKVKINEPLASKTTFKIGGRAGVFAEPEDIEDLRSVIVSAKKYRISVVILGAGSNILVRDKGVSGVVLRLSSPKFKKIAFYDDCVLAGSGCTLARLIREASKRSLSGLECLAGIPGTVGGALIMNAGAWGGCIGDLVEEVMILDYNGKTKAIKKKDIKFNYRTSNLAKFIILGAKLKLLKVRKREIEGKIKNFLAKRRQTQDNASPNAGCIFKNPDGNSAGKLIDLCGLKGRHVGGAVISRKHANFILNKRNAKARDVLELMGLIKDKVRNKFKVNLKPEIKIWG